MKKNSLIICFIVIFSISLSYAQNFFSGGGNVKSDNVVKIGIYEPLTGDNEAGGKYEALGVMYANSLTPTVMIDGKKYTVQLEIVDNKSSDTYAPNAARQLVQKGVSVALGSYGSGVSIAGSSVFASANVPVIGITCSNPLVTSDNNHYFRICFLDPFQGTVLANFAMTKYYAQKAFCLAKEYDVYSTGLCNFFMDTFRGNGGITVFEQFGENTTDFTPYIEAAMNSGAEVFFAPVSIEAATHIIAQATKKGMKIPILAGDTWDSSFIANAAKNIEADVVVTTSFVEGGKNAEAQKFETGFKKWLAKNPDALKANGGDDEISAASAMGFDAYYVAIEALKAARSTNGADIMKVLPSIKYTGITGVIKFDETGDAERNIAYVKEIDKQSGGWKFVSTQKASSNFFAF